MRAATVAGGTPTEGLAGDRFALDGSLCVHAGYSNATALGEPNSAREPRDVVEPGSAPGVWVPLGRLVDDDWCGPKKTRHLALASYITWISFGSRRSIRL